MPAYTETSYTKIKLQVIARKWRRAHISTSNIANNTDYGWTITEEPKWMNFVMPEYVKELFVYHSEESYQEDSNDSECDH